MQAAYAIDITTKILTASVSIIDLFHDCVSYLNTIASKMLRLWRFG